jgi:hypothetical protein
VVLGPIIFVGRVTSVHSIPLTDAEARAEDADGKDEEFKQNCC